MGKDIQELAKSDPEAPSRVDETFNMKEENTTQQIKVIMVHTNEEGSFRKRQNLKYRQTSTLIQKIIRDGNERQSSAKGQQRPLTEA